MLIAMDRNTNEYFFTGMTMFSLYIEAQFYVCIYVRMSYSICFSSFILFFFARHSDISSSYCEIALNLFSSLIIFSNWH